MSLEERKRIHDEVQAILLNSETDPEEAVAAALEAVAEFAESELGIDAEGFSGRAEEAHEDAVES